MNLKDVKSLIQDVAEMNGFEVLAIKKIDKETLSVTMKTTVTEKQYIFWVNTKHIAYELIVFNDLCREITSAR